MKRTFAVVALLAALGVLCKLTLKEQPGAGADRRAAEPDLAAPAEPDLEAELVARYPKDRALVARVVDRYRQTAIRIEHTDGLRGLVLLDRLDLEAIYLYEKYPKDFRRLRDSLTDNAAADLLLHWREYFGLKRADDTDRGILIAEIARLTPSQRRVAARYPSILPLVLADPEGMTELVERYSGDDPGLSNALAVLSFISLEPGATDIRAALRTLEHHGPRALEAFRIQGLDGFALVSLYGPVVDAVGEALPLDQTLIVLKVNADYVDELLQTHRPEAVASHIEHVAAAGLIEKVGSSPHGLRLAVEYGDLGERALSQAGPDAADVVYDDYSDPSLRAQAVAALAEHGTMALAMLDKYAVDPAFREILRAHGPAVIPPIAQADAGPEALAALRSKSKRSFTESLAQGVLALSGDNGQATIRMIQQDGLERVATLNSTELEFYQFLPLYDVIHLGTVMSRGHSPTSGEMTWALVDGTFVVADVLSLSAIQPEGAAASELARAELKGAAKGAATVAGRELAEETAEVGAHALARRGAAEGSQAVTERLSRWWSVRLAGGTYQVLRRMPEALDRMSLAELTSLGRPLCARAGLHLSTWRPLRFLKNGQEILRRIPPERGLKYVGAQAVQAGVGVVGFHKMEEHLASRRPHQP
ncbi:MAG TPA: hypothetical protein VGZ22_13440 [Isosphaeraceae bacterium]|jgi:hypothetical protein|nr:hypothetical protein [Isosphaeraceae bacterium]